VHERGGAGQRVERARAETVARVSLVDVTKRYAGGQEAIAELNLEIADGELVVLVGPSGSGNSTALRMIAGLEGISSGDVWIGDRVVNDLAAAGPRRRDGFQNYALWCRRDTGDSLTQLRGTRTHALPVPVDDASDGGVVV
jgi:ABC-type sulfate/molybdate transport systems ATPase subunit